MHIDSVPIGLLSWVEPIGPGSDHCCWTLAAHDIISNWFACKVCGCTPDTDGSRSHGRGCYMADPDGGGYDSIDVDEIIAVLKRETL